MEVNGQLHTGTDWRPGKRSTETHGLAGCVQVLVGDRICAVSSTFLILSKANEFVLSGRLAKTSKAKQNKTKQRNLITGLKRPRGFQKVEAPRFQDNR